MDIQPRPPSARGAPRRRVPRRLAASALALYRLSASALALCSLSACGTLLGLDEHRVAGALDTSEPSDCTTSAAGCEMPPAEPAPGESCASPPCPAASSPGESSEQGPAVNVSELAPVPEVRPLAPDPACLSESRGMELRPLALYMMLDSSGSMEETTGLPGRTKWDAVLRAIRGFLVETRESDLQLGMQFFPLIKPGVRSFICTSHEDCGEDGGPCFLNTCQNGSTIQLCRTDEDCPGGAGENPCVTFGLCSLSDPAAPLACVLSGAATTCGDGQGTCQDFERTCTNATSCDPVAYATPAVEIAPVAQVISPIDQALTNKAPEGLTPTVPALQGTLDHARAWALAHPNHTVATLLATDGLPTECGFMEQMDGTETINEVLRIAGQGVTLTPAIRTFVIGVFQPGDRASINNVNAIAQAGGTVQAVSIDSTGEVEQEFLEALRAVKNAAAPCRLPLRSGADLDYSRIDVHVDAGDGVRMTLPHVGGLVGCAAEQTGWYYYTPADGGERALELCPNICQVVKLAPSAGLQIEVGCAGQ